MDRKVELEILTLTASQYKNDTFVVLLGETEGNRQLTVTIGAVEAKAILLHLRGIRSPRPLTHDLFMAGISVLGASLLRVLIYKIDEGVYYSYIYLKRENEIIRMDARTSDALALAVRAGCPIFIYDILLEEEFRRLKGHEEKEGISLGALREQLEKAIKEEDYEQAARLRDEIRQRDRNQ